MKLRYAFMGVVLSVSVCCMLEAAKNYTKVTTIAEFDKLLKAKPHMVVWFYRKEPKQTLTPVEQQAHDTLTGIYERVAGLELKKDKKKIVFVSINAVKGDGENIFQQYNILNDGEGTLITLDDGPKIILFKNGKMINSEMGGFMSEEGLKSYVERYFGISKEKSTKKSWWPWKKK